MKKVSVIGSGAWGTTLAKILAENGFSVYLWTHSKDVVESIQNDRINKLYCANIVLPQAIETGLDLQKSCEADLVVLAITSSFYNDTLVQIKPFLKKETLILSATKGLNPINSCRMSEVAFSLLPENFHTQIGFLSGPNISKEIALQKPATTVIAAKTLSVANKIGAFFNNAYFRVYVNDDIIGTELGGTLKNIIAIASGVIDGLNLGINARSSLIVRGMVEIERFSTFFGAKQKTLYGLSGMGDLITTCSSPLSRNNILGKALAQGVSLKNFLEKNNFVVEGVETCRFVYQVAQNNNIEMPITNQIYVVLFEGKSIQKSIESLMDRNIDFE